MPATLYATVTGSGDVSGINGVVTLVWNGTAWVGSGNVGTTDVTFTFSCSENGTTWVLEFFFNECQPESNTAETDELSCDPFAIEYNLCDSISGCCTTGLVTISITE